MPQSPRQWVTSIRPGGGLVVVIAICVVGSLSLRVQTSLALTNGGTITSFGTQLNENFDSLINSGTATWINNSTIPGWYHARSGTGTTIVADAGSSTAGNL